MKIKKYTRVTAFFLAVCTVLLMLPLSVRADEYWPDGVKTQSKSAIVMEVNTGTVLYENKSHEKSPQARSFMKKIVMKHTTRRVSQRS